MGNYIETDILIIGAGILGCMAARKLAKYDLSITVLEKNCDVGRGITRANTAIIYPGYDQHPGSLKAELTVQANRSFEQLCRDLDVPYKKCGSLMIGFGPNAEKTLQKKFNQGLENGVEGIKLIRTDEILALEPNLFNTIQKQDSNIRENVSSHERLLNDVMLSSQETEATSDPTVALYSETAGTVNPWQLCIAAYENARDNGVNFVFNSEVTDIKQKNSHENIVNTDYTDSDNYGKAVISMCSGMESSIEVKNDKKKEPESLENNPEESSADNEKKNKKFLVKTNNETYEAKAVLITAGLDAANIWEMVEKPQVRIKPLAADYLILDTNTEGIINHIIQVEPEEKGEGLTMVPTVDGNMLIGPTRRDYIPINNRKEKNTSLCDDGYYICGCKNKEDKYFDTDFPTELNGIKSLERKMHELVPQFSWNDVIRYFGTLRPNPYYVVETDNGYEQSGKSINDFEILEKDGLFNLIGIKTPGITCSNELGKYIAENIVTYLNNNIYLFEKDSKDDIYLDSSQNPKEGSIIFNKPRENTQNTIKAAKCNEVINRIKLKTNYNPHRKGITAFRDLSPEEANKLIKENPQYGNIICRCRKVSEAEIVEAVKRGATDLEGVKRRVNTGMGRCQGSSCDEEIVKIIARETDKKISEII